MLLGKIIKKNVYGLTLVETTVALGILMMGIIACLTLMIASFDYVRRAEQHIVVVNLAREGLEIVRSIRNNEGDNSILFDIESEQQFTVDSSTKDTITMINTGHVTASSVSQCGDCNLYLNNGRYTHDNAGEETVFKRMITIRPRGVIDYEKTIISQVSWTVKGRTYTYTLEGRLTDWQ